MVCLRFQQRCAVLYIVSFGVLVFESYGLHIPSSKVTMLLHCISALLMSLYHLSKTVVNCTQMSQKLSPVFPALDDKVYLFRVVLSCPRYEFPFRAFGGNPAILTSVLLSLYAARLSYPFIGCSLVVDLFCKKVRFEPSSLFKVSFLWATLNGWEHEQTGLGSWLLFMWQCARLMAIEMCTRRRKNQKLLDVYGKMIIW